MLLYLLEAPHQDASNEYNSICFLAEIRKKNIMWIFPLIWSSEKRTLRLRVQRLP